MRMFTGCLWRAAAFISALMLLAMPSAVAAGAPGVSAVVLQYGDVLRSFNRGMSAVQSQDMAAHVLMMSSYYRLDPRLLVAIVGVESSWHPAAVSPAGAQGLGQLMPATASGLGVLTGDAYENLDGTARYLRRMITRFSGADIAHRYALAIAGYNAGPQAVTRFGGIPPFAETRAYVAHVMALWRMLQARLPGDDADAAPLAAVARVRPPVAHLRPRSPKSVLAVRATHPAVVSGSVAQFAALEAGAMDRYYTDLVAAAFATSAVPMHTPQFAHAAPVAASAPPASAALSMADYFTYDASPPTARPVPAPERKSLKRWLARTFANARP